MLLKMCLLGPPHAAVALDDVDRLLSLRPWGSETTVSVELAPGEAPTLAEALPGSRIRDPCRSCRHRARPPLRIEPGIRHVRRSSFESSKNRELITMQRATR